MSAVALNQDNIPEPPSNTKTLRVLDEKGNLLDWSTYDGDDHYAMALAVNWWAKFGKNIHVELVSETGERRLVEPQG